MDENTPKVIARCPFKDCKKKLSLMNYACKCGVVYCPAHVADTVHNCTYDFKAEYQAKLNKNLVKVNGTKVDHL